MSPRIRTAFLAGLLLLTPLVSPADNFETMLMPGKLIDGHAKLENDCKNCHVPFKKTGQRDLCLDCHKEVARDVQAHAGYHGRLKGEPDCRECHTDHKGRDMKIAAFDHKKFDHRMTDYVLRGAHTGPKVACHDCHLPGKKYREAPSDCFSCHKKDDKHKGGLGPHCDDCHKETNWKDTRFDHSKTKFPLKGKHADTPCRDCHKDPQFKGAPTQCLACHRKDDKHKGHFGPKCETCHNEKDWKSILFNHDRDTDYPLRGRHARVKCIKCHTTPDIYKDKLERICVACHRKDDKEKGHKGRYGTRCESCHVEQAWDMIKFDHDRDTKYLLRGKHAQVKCDKCHSGNLYRDRLQTTCFACHEKDDKHKGQEGEKCESCHTDRTWKKASFDHGLSRFPLLGAHAKVKCEKCHTTAAFKDVKDTCVGCHKKDDKHKQKLGPQCDLCHGPRDWKTWSFDHDKRTAFALDGGHKGIQCEACHRQPMPKKVSVTSTCASCHDEDDVHNGEFGRHCEQCHVTSSFKTIRAGIGTVPY
jgi:hypothetical protein